MKTKDKLNELESVDFYLGEKFLGCAIGGPAAARMYENLKMKHYGKGKIRFTPTETVKTMKTMKKEKKYAVAASYEHGKYARNEVISRHATYELAEQAIKRGPYKTFRGIREIDGDRIK